MKRTLFAAVAALCLAACNSDSGPERTTPAEFGEVTFSPAEVASPMRSFEAETRALTYKGIIPGQKAGRKVTFRVRAITAYDVVTYSDPRSYTIPDGEGDEKTEQPN